MPANHRTPHTEEAKAKMRAARLGKPAPWKLRRSVEIEGTLHYQCSRCEGLFTVGHFYKNKRSPLGIKSECKACHIATAIASRDRDNARATNAAYMRRARANDPEKYRERERRASAARGHDERTVARAALNRAVLAGKLIRPEQCPVCGLIRPIQGHHDDYAKPLVVRWMCSSCHGKEHRKP